jgi:DNA-binding response OmpR family regulator
MAQLPKLLLIEDDHEIALALSQVLATHYEISLVHNGQKGLERAKGCQYSAVVLDLNLPDMSGLEVCHQLRELDSLVPILVLTAEARIMNKIQLLDAGADDYLTKPFSLGELKARLRVLLRSSQVSRQISQRLQAGDLTLDITRRQAERNGQQISLRRKEFAVLECLMQYPGAVVSREQLGSYAWHHTENIWPNTIDVQIKYLRDKIDRPFNYPMIQTVHGIGYKLVATQPDHAGKRL